MVDRGGVRQRAYGGESWRFGISFKAAALDLTEGWEI